MNGQIDLITLISLIVAAVAIFKLRSVLGQRTDEDENRIERAKTREREAQNVAAGQTGDVITLPRRPRDETPGPALPEPDDVDARIKSYPAIDPSVTAGLLEVSKFDAETDPAAFLRGAGMAYEMIVSAFASGDRKTLKDLLSREVYDGFSTAIAEREARGETIEQQFVGIRRSDIVEVEMKSGIAFMTVRFVSELITSVLDKAGAVISGDPQKITDVTDIWTFSRDVSNARALSNPNWKLVATQAPN